MAQQSTTSGKRWLSRSGGASWAVGWLSLILLAWVGHPHRVQAAAGAGPQLPDGVAEVQDPLTRRLRRAITVRPNSFSVSLSLNFDENGRVRHESQSAYLSLAVNTDADERILAIDEVVVDQVRTDDDHFLPTRDSSSRANYRHLVNQHHHSSNLSANIRFEQVPPRSSKSLKRIAGRLKVRYATGEPKRATLAPLEKYLGRKIRFAGLKDQWLALRRDDDGEDRWELEMKRSILPHVRQIEFQDGRGNAQPFSHRGASYNDERITLRLQVAVPDDGKLMVQVQPNLRQLEVPFELGPIDLPWGDEAGQDDGDVVLELKDADQAEEAAAGEAADDKGLDVILEGEPVEPVD